MALIKLMDVGTRVDRTLFADFMQQLHLSDIRIRAYCLLGFGGDVNRRGALYFTSPSPQTLVAVNPSPPLTLIVLFIRTELVALLVGCRRCARCMSARCVVVVAYHCWRENHCCCRRYFLLPWLLTISNQVAYHTPPRFPLDVIENIRDGASLLFQRLGLSDFAPIDGVWILLKRFGCKWRFKSSSMNNLRYNESCSYRLKSRGNTFYRCSRSRTRWSRKSFLIVQKDFVFPSSYSLFLMIILGVMAFLAEVLLARGLHLEKTSKVTNIQYIE
ncbi:hypothetical protein Nepgr_028353 [Nepenthes gracilis]|uniref:Uncharacterized protein n=1 Tax=Nepenthes gracilis TaxID=150966 RepID=A0AAD3TA65_NEPGR|nr:hypothetical protein Nepgr_028353 [Nepenthes gracilis]